MCSSTGNRVRVTVVICALIQPKCFGEIFSQTEIDRSCTLTTAGRLCQVFATSLVFSRSPIIGGSRFGDVYILSDESVEPAVARDKP
ncbi:hypothetical protein Mp_1g22910 [Marchantia polymorpha subsp. ruderalis]|uniref:Uncharacterized protein n=2 Tax=Marchantia polymorpha TaxID=3197 RepID=A0AAF6AT98_MARPO|nr:hypothetical protein MARPO_0065s0087 [Marchantia polymorpha]BBM99668.1 hypothetical protein Mp_1g22910 [Marchantia polymorpha subsp. ruderalis]|eukprot:PTQ36291.1 hypothetical protein MARPO_0065s0087 [Marchantia polymorpha]